MTREFLNETQERFLKGVLTKLPIEKIAELYLFQPIKQGGVESGVAVIASVPEAPAVAEPESGDVGAVAAQDSADAGAVAAQDSADAGDAAELEVLDDAGAGAELGVVEESGDEDADAGASVDAEAVDDEADADAAVVVDAEAVVDEADVDAEAVVDAGADVDAELAATDEAIAGDDVETVEHGEIRAPGADVVASTAAEELETLDESGAGAELGVVEDEGANADAESDVGADTAGVDLAEAFDDELADVEPEPIDAGEEYPSQVAARYTVYSANYRLVLKGPDRGKWALDVKAEADAPLITLETVVRGVQQRSGDVEPPRRYDQAELREILRLPADTQTAAPEPGASPAR